MGTGALNFAVRLFPQGPKKLKQGLLRARSGSAAIDCRRLAFRSLPFPAVNLRRLSALRDKGVFHVGENASGWMSCSSLQCVMAQTGDNEIQLSTKSLHFFRKIGLILGKMPDIIGNGTQPLA